MANDDAWDAGWEQGASKKNKGKKKNDDADNDNQKKRQPKSGGGAGGGNPWSILSYIPRLHSGGKVKKTGEYRLRKGEVVLTATQQKAAGLKKKGGKKKSSGRKRTVVKA